MTERNLYQIFDLAKQLKIPWWYLMQVRIDLRNVRSKGYGIYWGVGGLLELEVYAPHGPFLMELRREKYNQRAESKHLIKIEQLVKRYGKGVPKNLYLNSEIAGLPRDTRKTLPKTEFECIKKTLTSEDPVVRATGILELSSFSEARPDFKPRIVTLLESYLTDPDEKVRINAEKVLLNLI